MKASDIRYSNKVKPLSEGYQVFLSDCGKYARYEGKKWRVVDLDETNNTIILQALTLAGLDFAKTAFAEFSGFKKSFNIVDQNLKPSHEC